MSQITSDYKRSVYKIFYDSKQGAKNVQKYLIALCYSLVRTYQAICLNNLLVPKNLYVLFLNDDKRGKINSIN